MGDVSFSHGRTQPLDGPIVAYRVLRTVLVVAAASLLVRVTLFSVAEIRTEQMSPTIQAGDRVLVSRALRWPLIGRLFRPRRGTPVVFRLPHRKGERGCLRVVGIGGDSLAITERRFTNAAMQAPSTPHPIHHDSILPPEYSPRDFMAPFVIPPRRTDVVLDSVPQRDFFFYASMCAQEHRSKRCDVRPRLYIDGIQSNDYIIANFLLYEGAFDSIPDSLDYDWFFWDRLRENLRYTLDNREVVLRFSLTRGGMKVDRYRVSKPFLFLLADEWTGGLDSRYFGPVCLSRIDGVALAVLWSSAPKRMSDGRRRPRRFLKRIRRRAG